MTSTTRRIATIALTVIAIVAIVGEIIVTLDNGTDLDLSNGVIVACVAAIAALLAGVSDGS